MRVILIGAPASGKGTQAVNIVNKYAIPHISVGDIFRKVLKDNSPLSDELRTYMDKGILVPDEIVIKITSERLKEEDCKKGFLLDGFPRTLNQAKEMAKFIDFDVAIFVDVEFNDLVNRIKNRMVCNNCGKIYDKSTCSDVNCCCGGEIIKRKDDTEEVFVQRIDEYNKHTYPVVEYFKELGKLVRVEGNQTPEQVFSKIKEILDNYD